MTLSATLLESLEKGSGNVVDQYVPAFFGYPFESTPSISSNSVFNTAKSFSTARQQRIHEKLAHTFCQSLSIAKGKVSKNFLSSSVTFIFIIVSSSILKVPIGFKRIQFK